MFFFGSGGLLHVGVERGQVIVTEFAGLRLFV